MDEQRRHLRVQARQAQQEHNERRRAKLHAVAVALRDPGQASAVIALARQYVNLWRDRALCSQDYIDAWSDLLDDPQAAADLLDERSPRADQLRQNSPFAAVVRAYAA
jgi:hypothetical protein